MSTTPPSPSTTPPEERGCIPFAKAHPYKTLAYGVVALLSIGFSAVVVFAGPEALDVALAAICSVGALFALPEVYIPLVVVAALGGTTALVTHLVRKHWKHPTLLTPSNSPTPQAS